MLGLGITLVVYTVVAVSALLLVGPAALAESSAPPLVTALAGGAGLIQWQWLVRAGATAATLG
ncbi:hypothetical protein, partial [Methanoculleus chikugoensis]|uniref:hypothetical protein n=1 Tax=Methanoculleus chikugoensis TaxID=118126 RepID=UPI001FB42010